MYPKDTKQALQTFISNNADKLILRKWNLAEELYQEFINLGHTMTLQYFKQALTRYRKEHDIQLINAENIYYKRRTASA
jgi:uncharacterized protein (DUF488 family)